MAGVSKNPPACGTEGGYQRHRRQHERTCQPCKTAHAEYQRDYYARNPERRWHKANPDKAHAWAREWQRPNKDQYLELKRQRTARERHGQDVGVVIAAFWDAQEGCCYLCGDPMVIDKVNIDHDHRCCPPNSSCAFCRRGLACPDCNVAIARAHDDPDRLRRIADNLEITLKETDARLAAKPEQPSLLEG